MEEGEREPQREGCDGQREGSRRRNAVKYEEKKGTWRKKGGILRHLRGGMEVEFQHTGKDIK